MCMCFVSLLLAGILPALESVLRDADYAVTPQHAADVLHSLGKATQGQDCAEHEQTIHKVASKLVAQLLGKPALNSMAQTAPGPPPIQQLNNKQLSLAVWSLSKQVAAKHIAMDDSALQFVDAVAAHAVASTVMDQHPNRACEHWSRMLYGIAKMGIKCEERPAIQHLFDLAVHRMSAMLQKGQRCEAQSMSNALWAFAVAGYRGSLEQMVPILDSRLKDLMKSALPQRPLCTRFVRESASGLELLLGPLTMPRTISSGWVWARKEGSPPDCPCCKLLPPIWHRVAGCYDAYITYMGCKWVAWLKFGSLKCLLTGSQPPNPMANSNVKGLSQTSPVL
eukprot:1158711-Pelagomonas_calceolata.AAC.14